MSVTPLIQRRDRFANLRLSDLSEDEKNTLANLAIAALTPNRGEPITCPDATRKYLQLKHSQHKNEIFGCLFLDTRHRLIAEEELFFGTINGASVHPRVVAQKSLELNAGAVILWHNHPSGMATISRADREVTTKLKESLALIDVRVIDHIVIGTEGIGSLAENGYL